MLSCQNVVEGQQNCNGTTWLLGGSKSTELLALVTFGQIEGETRTRTSITPNCSLIIKNITAEDDGQYECQQYKSEGSKYLPHRSVIDLSVITSEHFYTIFQSFFWNFFTIDNSRNDNSVNIFPTVTKHVENQTVTLSCWVMKYGSCKHKVKWLFSHQEMEKCKVKLSEKDRKCSATVICLESNSDNSSSMDQLFQCAVTGASKNVQLFSFSQHSSGEKTLEKSNSVEFY